MKCFASFCCGVMLLPAIGLGFVMSQPILPDATGTLDMNGGLTTFPYNHGYELKDMVGHLMAGESPTHAAKVIQTDEDGYVICSKAP